jgi:hypothetical protein
MQKTMQDKPLFYGLLTLIILLTIKFITNCIQMKEQLGGLYGLNGLGDLGGLDGLDGLGDLGDLGDLGGLLAKQPTFKLQSSPVLPNFPGGLKLPPWWKFLVPGPGPKPDSKPDPDPTLEPETGHGNHGGYGGYRGYRGNSHPGNYGYGYHGSDWYDPSGPGVSVTTNTSTIAPITTVEQVADSNPDTDEMEKEMTRRYFIHALVFALSATLIYTNMGSANNVGSTGSVSGVGSGSSVQ